MSATKIEWCDHTINPVVGCSKCSPGCDHCYAERFAARLAKNPATRRVYAPVVDDEGHWTGRINCVELNLATFDEWWNARVRKAKNGSRIFVGSMTDLFHENGLEDEGLLHIWSRMDAWPEHIFCVLTKRPERMRDFALLEDHCWTPYPLPNVWLGVTVCNQEEADAKIPWLLATPAVKRFVSIEPMLGPVDMQLHSHDGKSLHALTGAYSENPMAYLHEPEYDAPQLDLGIKIHTTIRALDWVICGGETGPGARPVHLDWVRGLRDQCVAAQVPFFFKGWGDWLPGENVFAGKDGRVSRHQDGRVGATTTNNLTANNYCTWDESGEMKFGPFGGRNTYRPVRFWSERVGKKRTGRLLDGREWNEVPK
jgi:protein gp37